MYPTEVTGTIGAVLDGTPLSLTGCGTPVRLSSGTHLVRIRATDQYTATRLTMLPSTSEARAGGEPGSVDHRDVAVRSWTTSRRVVDVAPGPAALLVLPENVNAGWRATLGGDQLTPVRVDGWMQGYVIPEGDGGRVTLDFTPNRLYQAGLALGGLLALLLLAAAVLAGRRERRSAPMRERRPARGARAGGPGDGACRPWPSRSSWEVRRSRPGLLVGDLGRRRLGDTGAVGARAGGGFGAGRRGRGEPAGESVGPAPDLVRRARGGGPRTRCRRAPDQGDVALRWRLTWLERTVWTAAAEALRPWRSAAGLVALALVAGQLAWRAVLLGRGYFTQDDFLMLTLGGRPLSLDLLMQNYSGHLFPGGFAIAWLHTHVAPLDWTVAVVEIVMLQLVASVLAWLVLCRLLPGSWWRLPVLSTYLFCPLALWPVQWWAVAIQYLPVSIFLFLAIWAMLHRLQEGSRWSGPLVVLATVAGLLFQERAVLYPVVLGFVAVAYAEAVGLRRIVVALRGHLVVWVPLVAVLARVRRGAPRAGADREHLAGLGCGVGRARRELPGAQRRAWLRRRSVGGPRTEHHRHPDGLGAGRRLVRPGRGRGPDAASLAVGRLGLVVSAGLHPGRRRPALRGPHRTGLR